MQVVTESRVGLTAYGTTLWNAFYKYGSHQIVGCESSILLQLSLTATKAASIRANHRYWLTKKIKLHGGIDVSDAEKQNP